VNPSRILSILLIVGAIVTVSALSGLPQTFLASLSAANDGEAVSNEAVLLEEPPKTKGSQIEPFDTLKETVSEDFKEQDDEAEEPGARRRGGGGGGGGGGGAGVASSTSEPSTTPSQSPAPLEDTNNYIIEFMDSPVAKQKSKSGIKSIDGYMANLENIHSQFRQFVEDFSVVRGQNRPFISREYFTGMQQL